MAQYLPHCTSPTKENNILGSPGETPGRLPPKCKMQCPGQTSIDGQNFSQIRSAVSEQFWSVGWLVVTRVHCGQTVHPRPIVTMEH